MNLVAWLLPCSVFIGCLATAVEDLREHPTEAASRQSSPRKEVITLRFGKTPRFEAKLQLLGGTGLIWIENQPTHKKRISFIEVIDDYSFEPLRLLKFRVPGSSDSWVVFAEYYHSSWVYARFFLISDARITEPLGFSHRDPNSISFVLDRAGRLSEVIFKDRWSGKRTPQRNVPDMFWCWQTRYRVRASMPWPVVDERWKHERS